MNLKAAAIHKAGHDQALHARLKLLHFFDSHTENGVLQCKQEV